MRPQRPAVCGAALRAAGRGMGAPVNWWSLLGWLRAAPDGARATVPVTVPAAAAAMAQWVGIEDIDALLHDKTVLMVFVTAVVLSVMAIACSLIMLRVACDYWVSVVAVLVVGGIVLGISLPYIYFVV